MTPKLHISDSLALPLDTVTDTVGVLAVKGSGKSYTSMVLVEETIAAAMGDFYYGDNLDVLRGRAIKDESVDLVYLDPPFNSKRNFNVIHREADGTVSEAQHRAFEDTWAMDSKAREALSFLTLPGKDRWKVPARLSETYEMLQRILGSDSTMLAYLAMMGVRLAELRRAMKPTASLYLHCDPTASHYLKLILDALFGPENFFSDVVWKRYGAHGDAQRYGAVHDNILFYGKTRDANFNKKFIPYAADYAESRFRHVDSTGRRYQEQNLSSPNPRPNLTYKYTASNGVTYEPHKNGWKCELERMKELDAQGRLHFPKSRTGRLRLKMYLDESEGVPLQDVWTDVLLPATSRERLGYPTQKPVALLERIIESSSNPGDLVLDPFAGCGTTIEAAEKLGRRWIGIDVTHLAVSILRRRMEGRFPDLQLTVHGEPADVASARALAESDKHEFQAWIVDKIGGVPLEGATDRKTAKKGGDRGIDGLLLFRDDPKATHSQRMIISVKASGVVTPEMVRELRGTMVREKAPLAALLLLNEPTEGMRKEAKADGVYRSEFFKPVDKIQILSVVDIFAGRELKVPGTVTTHRSVPPAGTKGSSLDLFEPKGRPRKAKATPPHEQQELAVGRSK